MTLSCPFCKPEYICPNITALTTHFILKHEGETAQAYARLKSKIEQRIKELEGQELEYQCRCMCDDPIVQVIKELKALLT